MKKSFMNNIKNFVDSNVRQRIDRVAHNNNEFFSDDLLLVERHFEDIRHVCIEAEKRISTMLQSIQSNSLGAYTQNVQVGLNNLSQNIAQATTSGNSTGNINSFKGVQNNNNNLIVSGESSSKSSSHSNMVPQSCHSNEFSANSNFNGINLTSSHTDHDSTQQLANDIQHRHKKLSIVGFLKFMVKSSHKLKPDSLLATTLTHCSQLQSQLTKLYLTYEQTIDSQCLKPIQHILEIDIPNVVKLRKLFIKSHNDLESIKAKYNGASQKQQQLQAGHFTSTSYTITQSSAHQANINKLDQLKKELDDAMTRFEQAKDTYEAELYAFVCRETELVDLFRMFYQLEADYHQQASNIIQNSLPALNRTLACTPRKAVFGTQLDEHLRCTYRSVSPVIELCTHLLYSQGLNEEGLFRIPGSSVKMKKLKNAINAWFVTLASRSELENDQQRQSGYSSVVALHDLFKNIVGQRQIQHGDKSIPTAAATTNDDSTLTPSSVSVAQDDQMILDVHSIAGLLKLYLRELPEPLFTYSLYEQWINAVTVKVNSYEERFDALSRVIEQLPKSAKDNLKHLIRFLYLLTCHQEFNKMTSTNLAITMAPSLIWSKTIVAKQQTSQECPPTQSIAEAEDASLLNMQMSSIGMSASLHAIVLEALITHAESLFPGQVDFTLPGFGDLTLNSSQQKMPKRDRSVKSTSPTCLSTASSSSFSSNTSNSSSAKTKTHSRKGGSMDGLLGGSSNDIETIPRDTILLNENRTTRPVSVHLQRGEYVSSTFHRQHPPPVPPVPTAKFHAKTANQNETTDQNTPLQQALKPPAPPVPPSAIQDQERDKLRKDRQAGEKLNQKPRAASLRGTGTIASSSCTNSNTSINNNSSLNATRPSVPPPDRPPKPGMYEATLHPTLEQDQGGVQETNRRVGSRSDEGDTKSSHSLTSSCNLRGDFEEISAGDIDEIDFSAPVSPVVSLDSISNDDDSSFDNDNHSLEYSWTECALTNDEQSELIKNHQESNIGQPGPDSALRQNVRPAPRTLGGKSKINPKQACNETGGNKQEVAATISAEVGNQDEIKQREQPPVKPPRSISPKITQSTPL